MTTKDFVFFYGGVFSQWYMHDMVIDGVTYNCAEQYMMAMKAKTFHDDANLASIMLSPSPSQQKSFGRSVSNFDPDMWACVAKNYVYKANRAKFSGVLKQQLLETENREIVEASPTDKIWGIGMAVTHPNILDKSKWQGTNWLGEVLMRVRDDLREEMRSGAW